MKELFLFIVLCILVLSLVACDNPVTPKNGENNNATSDPGNASLIVKIGRTKSTVYAPNKKDEDPEIISLIITFDEFSIHGTSSGSDDTDSADDAGWEYLELTNDTLDIFQIKTLADLISSADIGPGTYNVLRFYVTGAIVGTDDGKTYAANITSGTVQANIHFEVGGGEDATIELEMDPNASVKKNGDSYKLSPVIKVKKIKIDEDDSDED